MTEQIELNDRDQVATALNLPLVADMTDREIAEETLTHLRSVGAALKQFQGMGPAGLMKMLMSRS
jgi:mannose/fructose-specific phosphotransferase system component IIA